VLIVAAHAVPPFFYFFLQLRVDETCQPNAIVTRDVNGVLTMLLDGKTRYQ
jgi:hypothetical protein